ncbi:MAG TPA: type II toxin-antitoxin system HipA family toxin [Solirubrobacteraceae bacterium]
MTGRTLEVFCFGYLAGTLTDTAGGMAFAYDPSWIAAGRPPLSQSLPLSGDFSSEQTTAFFGGLLPEGPPRELLARQLGVSAGNDFGLLEQLGGDTAGAVSVLAAGQQPPEQSPTGEVRWLEEQELERLIAELPSRPMHADADGEYRLSLAGVQDKLPVIVGEDGRVGLTEGRRPSTHILKTPIERLPDTVANEALCLQLGRLLGIPTVAANPRRAGERECLLVTRYDRRPGAGGSTERLHQEDFCQALGIPSARKYEAEGGPGLADGFALLRRAVDVPARQAPLLLDYFALSFLVGNHDAHGKNYSLLYLPDSDRATLAPAYDVLSTVAYRKVRPMSRKLAMSVGGEYRPDYIRPRHLQRLLRDAGLGAAPSRRRLRALAERAPAAAAAVHNALLDAGWDADILGVIEEIVAQRAGWLLEIAAAGS